MMRHKYLGIISLILMASASYGTSIWVEGEDANEKNNKPHPWWYDQVKTENLSGNAWISNFHKTNVAILGYNLKVKEAGKYTFWLRCNTVANPSLSYQLDGGEWTKIDLNGDVRENINIAADNKPDMRFIAWVKVGKLQLTSGKHKLRFRMDSKNNNHGAIDCFCLTTDPFVPAGATKPGQSAGSVSSKPAPPEDAIWIEGEDAGKAQVKKHSWYDSVKKDVLSGGQWLHNYGSPGSAEYNFKVIKPDTYTFWVRLNPLRSEPAYQLDGSKWKSIDTKDARGRLNIASNNKPDMRFIAWVKAGKIKLAAGNHSIRFRFQNKLQNHGALDCFTFVRIPFTPSGATKPSIQSEIAAAPDAWFPVLFDDDEFSPDSVIDMSSLVEAPAGKYGILKQKGQDLQFEKASKPIKFWAVGANLGKQDTQEAMTQTAKFYRKHGINLIRQHTVLGAVGLMDKNGKFDQKKIDHYDRWFATMKKHGIYTTWSVVYPHHGAFVQAQDVPKDTFKNLKATGSKGRGGAIVSNDFINMDRHLQDAALKYFKALLNHKNPYTGMKYKDDPALVIVEMQNESNLFFHTINNLLNDKKAPGFAEDMRKRFFQFTKKKYGSKAAVAKAWGGKWQNQDNWEKGELRLMGAYHWGADGPTYEYKGQFRRCGDFIEFLADVQREYYKRRYQDIRKIGFKGPIVTTAWKGEGASSLANLWCDDVGDIIDRHNYFGGGDGGHVIVEGKVNNATHLSQPGRGLLNLALFQVQDKPFTVSEWSMMPPNPYKAEAAPLYAFYGLGLQGWDISYHFATGAQRMGNGWPGLGKYTSQTPHYMGQFPALAFAVMNNHVKEAPVVAKRVVTEDMMFCGKDALGQSIGGGGHDTKVLGKNVVTPPEAVAVGKVTIEFGKDQPIEKSLSSYWDKGHKLIHSATKELTWDYGKRVVQVATPKTQAIIGFGQNQTFKLPGVRVKSIKTPFMSLIFTPLDNQDLDKSRKILITAMARDKQTGTVYNADWSRLQTIGGPPLLMEPVQATVQLKGAKPKQVQPLDVYGVPKQTTVKLNSDGSFNIDGTYRTYYYYVTR